jgi:hypothetical protein
MAVTPTITPSVTVTGATTVLSGWVTVMYAVGISPGTSPSYQWQDSTHTYGWQNIPGGTGVNINYTPVATGDKLRCIMTSNAICATPSLVTSAPVIFTVNFPTGIGPVQQSSDHIRIYPNPAHTTITIDSLKIFDKWESVELMSIDGKQKISREKIRGRLSVTIRIDQLSAGMYIVILHRKSKEPLYLKFVKY